MNKEKKEFLINKMVSGVVMAIVFSLLVSNNFLGSRNIRFNTTIYYMYLLILIVILPFVSLLTGLGEYTMDKKIRDIRDKKIKTMFSSDELYCFKCKNTIIFLEQKCSKCGWTWKL